LDPVYLKKTIKSEISPYQEINASRKLTFDELLKEMSIVFNENHKNGRLWIEDECIYGPKLEETLESSGIING